jgi:uroporphyrin-3 C-methyltransferase
VSDTPVTLPPAPPADASPAAPPAASAVAPAPGPGRWIATGAAVLAALTAAALVLAWNTQQRVKTLEGELVKRQQDSGAQAAEARLLAVQAQQVRATAPPSWRCWKRAWPRPRCSAPRSRNCCSPWPARATKTCWPTPRPPSAWRLQQSAITGSADALITTLKQIDERLARYNQPRLERVRRAVAQDLDRARAAGATDVPLLTLRMDEVIRLVDELPLLSAVDRKAAVQRPAAAAAPAASAASAPATLADNLAGAWQHWLERVWAEARSLVRVTRIDMPEAMLVAPEQAFFLRENLKLRLLNARLALLSRQFDIAQSDLRDAQSALERYFDRGSRRVTTAIDSVRQITAQARTVTVPRPDATLAAITAAAAGR